VNERLHTPQPVPRRVAADVHRDPDQPRLDRLLQIKAMEILEGSEEHFLRRVPRFVTRAEHPGRHIHHAGFVAQDDEFERAGIAA
jgi:hypothetical protein